MVYAHTGESAVVVASSRHHAAQLLNQYYKQHNIPKVINPKDFSIINPVQVGVTILNASKRVESEASIRKKRQQAQRIADQRAADQGDL